MKNKMGIIMAALLVVFSTCLWTTRAYAKDNTASAMRMKKTEGIVKVISSNGKGIAVFENMKLQSGHKVDTMEKSYAWISLDDAKLLKMDAVSEAGVRKKGKKLEVFLESGSLFFNVTEPLEDDETLNIRTSTMAVGIRGTSGWVEVIDKNNVKVSVLEGTVRVNVSDPLTGKVKGADVSAGESAICVVYDENKAGGWNAATS